MNEDTIAQFRRTGSLVLSGLLPPETVAAALAEAPGPNWGPNTEPSKIAYSDLTEVMRQIYERARPSAEVLLGKPADFQHAIWSVHQTGNGFGGSPTWHLDGFGTLYHGGTWDQVPGFELLVGVFLTDLSTPKRGNLMLAEGGHEVVGQWFRENASRFAGPDGRVHDPSALKTAIRAEPLIPDRLPLLANAGDVVFVHSMVPHTVDVNEGPTRPAIYFRLGDQRYGGIENLKRPW